MVAIQLADNPTPCVFQVKGNENVRSQTITWNQNSWSLVHERYIWNMQPEMTKKQKGCAKQ